MPSGLQVWDSDGYLEVDLTTRVGRVLDSFAISYTNNPTGSKSYDIQNTETLIAIDRFDRDAFAYYPQVSVTYNATKTLATVSWAYPSVTIPSGSNKYRSSGSIIVMVI